MTEHPCNSSLPPKLIRLHAAAKPWGVLQLWRSSRMLSHLQHAVRLVFQR